MKRFLIVCAMALAATILVETPVSAWSNFHFANNFSIGWQSGGNRILWGLWDGGPYPIVTTPYGLGTYPTPPFYGSNPGPFQKMPGQAPPQGYGPPQMCCPYPWASPYYGGMPGCCGGMPMYPPMAMGYGMTSPYGGPAMYDPNAGMMAYQAMQNPMLASAMMPYGGMPYGAMPYGSMPYGGMPYGEMPYGAMPYGNPYQAMPSGSPTPVMPNAAGSVQGSETGLQPVPSQAQQIGFNWMTGYPIWGSAPSYWYPH